MLYDSDLEVSLLTLYGLNLRECKKLNVYMPADLDQFG